MMRRTLTWCSNVLLACLLVIVCTQNIATAQDNTPDEPAGPNGGTEEGRILVPLSGTATSMQVDGLKVIPASIDTGVVQIGESKTQSVVLKHEGADDALPIDISTANLFGKSMNEYSTDFVGFVTLLPGEEVKFDVVFTPTLPGTKSAGLRMDVEGASAPYILLFSGWSRYPLTSDLDINVEKVNFGEIAVGSGNSNQTIKLKNMGEKGAPDINVWNIDVSGDTPQAFNIQNDQFKLKPGQTVDVKMSMSAANEGFKAADIIVNHNGNNAALEATLEGSVVKPNSVPVNFGQSILNNAEVTRATTVQFGPDGKLYVGEMGGTIKVFAVNRVGKNNYTANLLETIDNIQQVQNHDDDGKPNNDIKGRLLTGIFVTGSANAPVIYAASSDPRQAAGPSGKDANLDTNSGILHRLTKGGGGWNKQDLVRGLPRSEENHIANGLVMHQNKILIVMGGHTNQGVPSNNFAELAEYALSAAILEIDVQSIGNGTYDLPTLDDEDRPGTNDENDPFGGNDGKNQAKLVQNGPVKIFSSGYRNAYDIALTESGNLYTFDNGPNSGWGGLPKANCANTIDNGGKHLFDHLHLVYKGFYAGHPNPTRGNKDNKFNDSNPQSPIEVAANPEECKYKEPGNSDGALTTISASSNGLAEYTASNFLGAMKGDLLVASFNKSVYRLQLNNQGTKVTSKSQLVAGLGTVPLDVTTRGDNDSFPGTIWVIDNLEKGVTILEPSDY